MPYIDPQVNGYAGVDFLGELVTAEQLQFVADRLRAGDVRAILPTITTSDGPAMARRLANLRERIDELDLRQLMPAFHIEGPCISPEPGYRGAHDEQAIRPASPEALKPLIEAAGGVDRVAMVTLAPEVDQGLRTTRWLIDQGVIVAIGHSDASLDELRACEAMGVGLFTHFGNGCAGMVDRHDNVLNRVLSLDRLKVSLIPDGHHLPWFLLRTWIRHFGVDRCLFTTDCVAPADAPPGRYRVGHHEVDVGPDGKVVPPGGVARLAGSSLTMPQAYANAIEKLGLSGEDAARLCHDNAATLLSRWVT